MIEATAADAARILLDRRAAREHMLEFTEYTTPTWKPSKIHRIICDHLDRVMAEEIDRLMLLCPPQHGKSTTASKRAPALALGRNPAIDVVSASATAELVEEFGRSVRDCVGSYEYAQLFPQTTLSEDSQAKGRWNTSQGGSYYAVGFGGSLFGRGGNFGIIDDPFASWGEAQRENKRKEAWQWYQGTFYNRIRPKSPIIVIQHRTHEYDLAGHLFEMTKTGGDKWTVIEIPADLDDPPWPERYDRAALQRIKSNSSPMQWSALYQQKPMPDEGIFFQRAWFEFYDPRKPPDCRKYMTSDFAVTADDGDFTSLGTHGVDANDDLCLCMDYWTGQTTSDVWIDQICNQILKNRPLAFFGEGGPIRRSIEPFLLKRMRERKAYCRVEWIPSIADKGSRARALQARASMGKVKLPDNEVGHKVLAQLLSFPSGRFDDDVDMLSLLGRVIDEAHPATKAVADNTPRKDRYDRLFEISNQENTWRM